LFRTRARPLFSPARPLVPLHPSPRLLFGRATRARAVHLSVCRRFRCPQPLYSTFFPECAEDANEREVTSTIVADALRVYVAQSCDGDGDGNYNYSLAAAE